MRSVPRGQRRPARAAAALAVTVTLLLGAPVGAGAQSTTSSTGRQASNTSGSKSATTTPKSTTSSTQPPPPKAWILVDLGTGGVVDSGNDRVPMPPASLTKVVTALTAARRLPMASTVPISGRAEAQPANKAGVKAGQAWPMDDAMHELLMESANDLAMAYAEAVTPNADDFGAAMAETGRILGLQDADSWHDPAGLDDEHSIGGGNLVSARDLAIAARALVANPWLGSIVATPTYTFTAPDGVVHRADNHNKLLAGSKAYPGAIGVKTGFTKKAGHTFIGAARRGDRAMLVVVLNAPDAYGAATRLMDKGFASPAAATGDALPPYRALPAPPVNGRTRPSATPTTGTPTGSGAASAAGVAPVVAPDAEAAAGDAGADESTTQGTATAIPAATQHLRGAPAVSTGSSKQGVVAFCMGGLLALGALVVVRRRRQPFAGRPRRSRPGL